MRGFSDEYGSWKIICISRRSGRSVPLRQTRDVLPVEADRARGRVEQPQDQPRRSSTCRSPDSPTIPSVSPRRTVSVDVLDRVHLGLAAREHALLDREALGQVLELDEGSPLALTPPRLRRRAIGALRALLDASSSHGRWQASRCASGTGATSGGRSVGHGSKR